MSALLKGKAERRAASLHIYGNGVNNAESGFTVIEMLIAFTILAVVSGSLFQMFFVSARNNAKAVDMDSANGLAISAVELFKSEAGLDGAPMFMTDHDAISGYTWRCVAGDRYIKYYNNIWQELEIDLSNGGMDAEAPMGARFLLEAELSDSPGESSELNYVAASLSLTLDAAQDFRLVLNENAGEIEAVFNGIPQTIDKSRIGRILSVNVEFNRIGALPKHIDVVNRTSLTANINVFGVPGADAPVGVNAAGNFGAGGLDSGGDIPADAGDDSRNRYVEVTAASGPVSVMYLGEQARSADNRMRSIVVSVRGLPPDAVELARVSANRYTPG